MTGAQPFSAPQRWTALETGVWVGTVEPETVNVGLVAGERSAVLIDCGSSPAQGTAVRASAEALCGVPLTAVVVTHWHHDHAFGLGAFADLETIGHESVTERLRSEAVAVPRRTLAVATALDLGGRRVEIVHLGRGHTDGDLVVVVPDTDVVFAGDLIESSGEPQYGPDSFSAEWPSALDGLIGLMTETTRAVPGHGHPVGREFVFEARGRAAMAANPGAPPGRPELPLI